MAKLKMLRVTIAALITDSQSIIERLQRRGVVELRQVTDERLEKINTAPSVAIFERNLAAARAARETVLRFYKKDGSLLSFLSGRKTMDTDGFAEKKESAAAVLSECYGIIEKEKEYISLNESVCKITSENDALYPWLELPFDTARAATGYTATFAGTLPSVMNEEEIHSRLSENIGSEAVFVKTLGASKGCTRLFVTVMKEYAGKAEEALRKMEFIRFRTPAGTGVADAIAEGDKNIAEAKKKAEDIAQKISGKGKILPDIDFLEDFLVMRIDKYKALAEVGLSEKTMIIEGYIPEKYAAGLEKEFSSKYDAAIVFTDPEETDDVPVLLENNPLSEPLEGITEMYSMPGKSDPDPSPVMAFFYYVFFGMMLSDAGYGLLMAIVCHLVLKKTSVEGSLRKSLTLFRNCGISTVFWGALFGSWFGDLPQVIAQNFFGAGEFSTALWFEPLDKPITLLLFSFGLGICHLFLGLAVHFRMLCKEGKVLDAILEVVPTYITILGVAPIGAGILMKGIPEILTEIGLYMTAAGAVLIVLTAGRTRKSFLMRIFGGIYGLYNIATGYLGDILSYSRLLALGLATGCIAGVINLIATMPSDPVLKAILLVVVGTVGHTANLLVNLLGAYVHSDRLQFVELFSKFYEGGGRAFEPFRANTKFFKFKKENIYHD